MVVCQGDFVVACYVITMTNREMIEEYWVTTLLVPTTPEKIGNKDNNNKNCHLLVPTKCQQSLDVLHIVIPFHAMKMTLWSGKYYPYFIPRK